MLGNYRAILAEQSARRFTVAGFIGRMPMSMVGLSIIMLVQHRTDSYALAASVAATASLSGASLAPLLSKAADRLGQARMLRITCVTQTVGLGGLLLNITDRVSPLAFVFAAFLGGSTASIGAFVRARWSAYLRDRSLMQTAFAWESIVDEAIFIVGPVIATLLSDKVSDAAPFAVTLSLLYVGCLWLATQHSTEPRARRANHAGSAAMDGGVVVDSANTSSSLPDAQRGGHRGWPAATPGISGLILGAMFLGAMFSAADVSTVAYATEYGQRAFAGVMLGLLAAGSLVGGVVYGMRPASTRPNVTYSRAAMLVAVSVLPLPFVAEFAPAPLMSTGAMLLVSGACVAPTLTSAFALVDRMSERHRVTETLAWAMSGLGVGIAAMGMVIGAVIDRYGAGRGFWLVAALGLIHALASVINLPASGRRLQQMAAAPSPNGATGLTTTGS